MNPYLIIHKIEETINCIDALLHNPSFQDLKKDKRFAHLYNELSQDLGIDSTNLEVLLKKLKDYIDRRR